MKFYTEKLYNNYWNKIKNNNLTCIYYSNYIIRFIKNGKHHNLKNAAYVNFRGYKEFILNGYSYGSNKDFIKSSWRKFTKLQAFL